jgi:hypothetical protein
LPKRLFCSGLVLLATSLPLPATASAQVVPPMDTVILRTDSVAVQRMDTIWPALPVPLRVLPMQPLRSIGSAGEEHLRLDRLLGRAPGPGSLIRSPSSETERLRSDATISVALVAPEIVSVWNSDLPFSFNEGTMWAGRGLSYRMMGGVRVDAGPITAILAPQVVHQANREFQVIPFTNMVDPTRHPYSSPWHHRPASLDLPSRFGDGAFTVVDPGQSSLSATVGPVSAGFGTESLWWGPGIRNAIVMSNHAPGIPHLFLRTSGPLRTLLGELEGRWMVGRLDESEYFDDDPYNDVRSFSGLALELRPAFEPNLTLGFTRAVYAPSPAGRVEAAAAFDVFRSVGRPNSLLLDDLLREPGADQIFSLYGRWLFPAAGLETYAEWARSEQPSSLRDLLEMPHHSQGYTVGLQWAREIAGASALRLQGEATYLEPSASYRHRPVISWYASRPVPQGYTHRGQVIGASIGPGASSQWLAADYFRGRGTQVGAFAGRIRWDNEAFYRPLPRPFFSHDVSLFVGVRGGHAVGPVKVGAELSTGMRFNYLFQNWSRGFDPVHAVDVRNHSLRLYVSPLGGAR